jgi:hypothetical protein
MIDFGLKTFDRKPAKIVDSLCCANQRGPASFPIGFASLPKRGIGDSRRRSSEVSRRARRTVGSALPLRVPQGWRARRDRMRLRQLQRARKRVRVSAIASPGMPCLDRVSVPAAAPPQQTPIRPCASSSYPASAGRERSEKIKLKRRAKSKMVIQPKTISFTAAYSITSSALSSIDGGTLRPSDFAVLRLIASSNFVGCCTGSSVGEVPRRMRST